MAVKLSPVFNDAQLDSNGNPYSGAKIFTYAAGSTTKQTAYQDSGGISSHTNPIVLNARGEPPAPIWLTQGQTYKFVLAAPTDTDPPATPIRTVDNVSGVNDASISLDEWVTSGDTPTYVSATSFTVSGDKTSAYHKGRRLKTTNSGGTVYCMVISSAYGASTTVTVVNDSGSLDSGLSAVSLGIIKADNPSIDADMIHRKGTAVASATTTDIWSIAGDYVHVTGTTTITSLGTAPYAGAERTVIFDGALTLTHNATSLILPGAVNITTAANDRMTVKADTTGNMIVTQYTKASGTALVASAIPRSYLAGMTMSTAGASQTMTIAAGQATDSTNAVTISLGSALNKTTSAWSAGTGNGGLDTGAIANSTWYYFYAISKVDGTSDVVFSTSASSPTMPSGYTYYRRIGAGLTNGSAQWVKFTQSGDTFYWDAAVLDVSANNPGTAAVTRTLTVPRVTGIVHIGNWSVVDNPDGTNSLLVSTLNITDAAPSLSAAPLSQVSGADNAAGGATIQASGQIATLTNGSGQVRTRVSTSGANTNVYGATVGWVDRRGRDD